MIVLKSHKSGKRILPVLQTPQASVATPAHTAVVAAAAASFVAAAAVAVVAVAELLAAGIAVVAILAVGAAKCKENKLVLQQMSGCIYNHTKLL